MPYLRGAYNNQSSRYATGPTASKRDVIRLYRQVKALKPEIKYNDTTLSGSNLAAGTLIYSHLTAIEHGTTRKERIGSRIQVKSIQIRGKPIQSGTGFTPCTIFIVRSTNGAAPVAGDFTTGLHTGIFYDPQAGSELLCVIPYSGKEGYGVMIDKKVRFKRPINVSYQGPTVTTVMRNAIYVVCFNPDTGILQSVGLTCRLWYTDV